MLRTALILTTACTISVSALPASAADDDGNYAVRGLGSDPCSQFVRSVDEKDGRVEQYLSWTLGYLTARSRFTKNAFDTLPIVDANSVGGLVYNVCTSNPNATIENAAIGLIDFMDPLKVGSASEIVRLTAGDQSTVLRRETLDRVLDRIQSLGIAVKSEEGDGIDLAASLAKFQEDEGLSVTRIPDLETLIVLFLR